MKAALFESAGSGRALVVVDMSRTPFSDSAEPSALVAVAGAGRGRRGTGLVVTGAAVARLVALTGVDRVISVDASLDEGRSHLGG